MVTEKKRFTPQIPKLDLTNGTEMLLDFTEEAMNHLTAAKNSILVLETVPVDKSAIDNLFKTFHTIKGLANFLELDDIKSLTEESEMLLDMTRKRLLSFNGDIAKLTSKAVESLQILLMQLKEQIANGGELKSQYHDISSIIRLIRNITNQETEKNFDALEAIKDIPEIVLSVQHQEINALKQELIATGDNVTLKKAVFEKFLSDFQNLQNDLNETKSKLLERQRELSQERDLALKLTQQAQSGARKKSGFLANTAHEIRTLINAVLGFANLVREGALTQKQKSHVDAILQSGELLLGIVNDILDLSKVEAGKLRLEIIDFNLEDVVEEIFKIVRTKLDQKEVNLSFDVDEDVILEVAGDPTRLKQILINLLDNAIKFTEKGEVGLIIKKGKTPLPSRNALQFVVQDTGIGIPDNRKSMIFESFTQAEESTTRKYGGTGLGLALCKKYVEAMEGTIHVESEHGKGSRFIFTIPFYPQRSTEPSNKYLGELKEVSGKRFLIVDANKENAKSLELICKNLGLKSLGIMLQAKEAWDFFLQNKQNKIKLPEIIFVDLSLPDKEGYMFAYKLRENNQLDKVKLVAVSSGISMDVTEKLKQAGFIEFLPKPFLSKELVNVLRNIFNIHLPSERVISDDLIGQISCEGIKVLVVEDSVPNQELLKIHFETLGCECDLVENGKEAVERLKNKEYDICFMDLQMPVMGGIEATQIIRKTISQSLPIIALTAADVSEERDHCFKIGMTDYLPKPFSVEQLKKIVIRSTKM